MLIQFTTTVTLEHYPCNFQELCRANFEKIMSGSIFVTISENILDQPRSQGCRNGLEKKQQSIREKNNYGTL